MPHEYNGKNQDQQEEMTSDDLFNMKTEHQLESNANET